MPRVSEVLHIRLDSELIQQVKRGARKLDRKVTDYIRIAIKRQVRVDGVVNGEKGDKA